MVDPAGACYGYHAVSTGTKEQEGMSTLEKMLKEKRAEEKEQGDQAGAAQGSLKLNEQETVEFAIEALQKVLGVDFKSNQVEVAVCSKGNTRFRSLNEKEIDEFLTTISEKE